MSDKEADAKERAKQLDVERPCKELLLREWEQRYESYRSFRAQYLTILSITASGYIVGLAVALGEKFPTKYRPVVLVGAGLLLIASIAGHVIGISLIRKLGDRIDTLEESLRIRAFRTTRPLEIGLCWSLAIVAVTLIMTIYVLVWGL